MEKKYKIDKIEITDKYLILYISDSVYKLKYGEISERLANATNEERKSYRISPSGYGIHWNLIDEDLSIPGLINMA